MSRSTKEKRSKFRKLHESGCFVLPNPWDVGSACWSIWDSKRLPQPAPALPGPSGIPITDCLAVKTGVLVTLADQIRQQPTPLVFLSVDRLGLQHDLLEVLAAWPGETPGILIIDALDASRGGPSEAAFASLIELALPKIGDMSIVASIRTFDLINGRHFREAMRGDPLCAVSH